MKNLIYQYWEGDIPSGSFAGQATMEEYALRIGAEYLFEHNPGFVTNLGRRSVFYNMFKPVYDKRFHQYDHVLYADTDIFPVDGLRQSIFDNFTADIGICTEPFQPRHRATLARGICGENDERWAAAVKTRWNADMPRTPEGLLKVYNTGVVLFSNRGLARAHGKFVPFNRNRHDNARAETAPPTVAAQAARTVQPLVSVFRRRDLPLEPEFKKAVEDAHQGR